MAAVATSTEIEKSSRQAHVSSKSKNRTISFKTVVNDNSSSSPGIRNPVSSIETCVLPGEDMADADKEMASSVKEDVQLNLSPFSIRNFVFTIRGQDFSKCWPFRHRILERCVNNGLKLELPPFDPPPRGQVCLGQAAGQEPDFVNRILEQTTSKSAEMKTEDVLESSKEKLPHRGNPTVVETLKEGSDKHATAIQEMACGVECELQAKPLEQDLVEGMETIQLADAGAKSTFERSCDSKVMNSNTFEAGTTTKHSLLSYSAKADVMEDFVESGGIETVVSAKVKASCTYIDVAQDAQNPPHVDIDPGQVVQTDCQPHFDKETNTEGQRSKMTCRSSSEECRTQVRVQKLTHAHISKPSEVSECMNQCPNDNQESNGVKLPLSDVSTAQTVELALMEEQNKIESNKSGDNFNIIGMDSEVLAPQVCPVCLSFTSTSNTALNAHIDHCLATVLPGEKTQVRFQKNRIKARKTRSMADICATAPSRTLEDLEMSCQLWALNEDTVTRNVPCTLGWSDGLIRRQPRTRLYRGAGGIWKGNGQFVGESDLQQTSPSLDQGPCEHECAHKKRPVTEVSSGPSIPGISRRTKMAFNEQVSVTGSLGRVDARGCDVDMRAVDDDSPAIGRLQSTAGSLKIPLEPVFNLSCGGKGPVVTNKRRKRKKGVANLMCLQDVPKTTECMLLQGQEPSDHSWSQSLGFRGIIPVDTSAEEANRLLCRRGCLVDFTDDQQGDADANVPLEFNTGFPSSGADVYTKGKEEQIKSFSGGSKSMVSGTKKQKVAQIEPDQNCRTSNHAVQEQCVSGSFVEGTKKSKKMPVKIQAVASSRTFLKDTGSALVAHSHLVDVGSERGVLVDGSQHINMDGEAFLEAAVLEIPSNCQNKVCNRKNLVPEQGTARGNDSSNNEHAQVELAKEPPPACNLDLDQETQCFPESRSIILQGVVAECRQTTISSAKETPYFASGVAVELKDRTDELRSTENSSVIAPGNLAKTMSIDQALVGSLEQGENCDGKANKLGDLAEVFLSETCQANADNPNTNSQSDMELSEKALLTVCGKETAFLKRTVIPNELSSSVSLHKQIVKSRLCSSAGCLSEDTLKKLSNPHSSSNIPIKSMCSSAVVSDRCCRGASGEQKSLLSSLSWEVGLSQDLSCLQSTDVTKYGSDIETAPVEVSGVAGSATMANGFVPSGGFSIAYAENAKISAATNTLGIRKCDPHKVPWSRRADSPDISELDLPLKQIALEGLHVRAIRNTREVVGNETLINKQELMKAVGKAQLFTANRNTYAASESHVSEGLQKSRSFMHSTVNANDLASISPNQRDSLCDEITALGMVPMTHSAAASRLLCEEKCQLIHRNGVLGSSEKLDLINKKLTFPSNVLVDAAKPMPDATDREGAKEAVSHVLSIGKSGGVSNQQRGINPSLHFAINETCNMHEKISEIPLHEVADIHNAKRGTKPPISQMANQIMTTSLSTSSNEYINLIPASLNGPGGAFPVSSNSQTSGEFSHAGMDPRRDKSSRSDFASRLNSYGALSYPEEPGVVHIFGNPVFKLMGKNVMVTNKDAKSMGMGDPVIENGRGFHTAGSVCHLECMGPARGVDLLQDAYSRFSQPLVENSIFMSQDMFTSHAGVCSQGNHSLSRHNRDVHPHAMQSAVFPIYGNIEHSGFRNPVVQEPAISMSISGETLRGFGSAVGVQLERQTVLTPATQIPSEVIMTDDSFPSSGTCIPSVVHRNGHPVIQQHGIPWLGSSFPLSLEKAQIQNQTPTALCRQEHNVSADFLADLHKLGLSGTSSFRTSNQPSGTLSDIVQSSDTNLDRLWSTLSGPMQ